MKNVTKNKLIELVNSVGLTPLPETWEIINDNFNEQTTYHLYTKEGIFIDGCRSRGYEVYFDIVHLKQQQRSVAIQLRDTFNSYGYKSNIEIKQTLSRLPIISYLNHHNIYDEDLKLITTIIDKYKEYDKQ